MTKLTTPFGTPASWQAWISAAQDAGVSPAGLIIIEHPAPKAAPILRAGKRAGKFHAENAATTPTGCMITDIRLSCVREPIICP